MRHLKNNQETNPPLQQNHTLARADGAATVPVHAGRRATTDIPWLEGEIETFISAVTLGENVKEISVRLRNKTSSQVSDCYNVLAVAGLLNGPLDRHVERCSMALYDSFKLSIRSRARTPEEHKVWTWRSQSTSIMKVLALIKDREDQFGPRAQVLYLNWKGEGRDSRGGRQIRGEAEKVEFFDQGFNLG
ncbi:hypothetical protein B0H13DRAFT_1971609 [Mycena leptocephala]|nr:hypothetical protein B0H13DRAFT_1971609 [Mycena leptocephala]